MKKFFNITRNIFAVIGVVLFILLFVVACTPTASDEAVNESPAVAQYIQPTPTQTILPSPTAGPTPTPTPIPAPTATPIATPDFTPNIPTLESIPEYNQQPYVEINGNKANFDASLISDTSWESYYGLDNLGRCTMCIASIGQDLMPTDARESISSITPTGWVQAQYNGQYLYNRCHLIGYQLTDENANEYNLITGTRYLNIEGMLPFENKIAEYIKSTGNHVLYQVIPIFKDDELVARGVWMQAYSEEDNGAGVNFNVYCFNVQPGITIDYATGMSSEQAQSNPEENPSQDANSGSFSDFTEEQNEQTYILNTNSRKIHKPTCSAVSKMSEKNKQEYTGNIDGLINSGWSKCSLCF